jgi:hypothetical protein
MAIGKSQPPQVNSSPAKEIGCWAGQSSDSVTPLTRLTLACTEKQQALRRKAYHVLCWLGTLGQLSGRFLRGALDWMELLHLIPQIMRLLAGVSKAARVSAGSQSDWAPFL